MFLFISVSQSVSPHVHLPACTHTSADWFVAFLFRTELSYQFDTLYHGHVTIPIILLLECSTLFLFILPSPPLPFPMLSYSPVLSVMTSRYLQVRMSCILRVRVRIGRVVMPAHAHATLPTVSRTGHQKYRAHTPQKSGKFPPLLPSYKIRKREKLTHC